MSGADDLILVLNCGSSSIKFALFERGQPVARRPLWNGKVDGITGPTPTFGETGVPPAPVALDPAALLPWSGENPGLQEWAQVLIVCLGYAVILLSRSAGADRIGDLRPHGLPPEKWSSLK